MKIYDISQTLQEGISVWPGDPEMRHRWIQRIQNGESCNVAAVNMSLHTGTHIDAPLHLDDTGSDIAGVPLRSCMGPARVFSISAKKHIRAADLENLDWRGVERALFKCHDIYLDNDAAEFLVRRKILLIGITAPSVDALDSETLPAHRTLLANGVVILEGARLEKVPPGDYELVCLPLKLAGLDGSPVRAILVKRRH